MPPTKLPVSKLDPFFSLELIVVVFDTSESADVVPELLWLVVIVEVGTMVVVFETLVVLGVDFVVVDATVVVVDVVLGFKVVTVTVMLLEVGGAVDFVAGFEVVVVVFVLETGGPMVLGGCGGFPAGSVWILEFSGSTKVLELADPGERKKHCWVSGNLMFGPCHHRHLDLGHQSFARPGQPVSFLPGGLIEELISEGLKAGSIMSCDVGGALSTVPHM